MKKMNTSDLDLMNGIAFRGMIDKWAFIFVSKLRKELVKNKIGQTGELSRSIQRELIRNGGDLVAVLVKFHMYGRFRDMGVGRGMKAYERKTNKQNMTGANRYGANVNFTARKPARWFNKRKQAEIYKLRELLSKQLGDAVVQNFKNDFGTYTEYSLVL